MQMIDLFHDIEFTPDHPDAQALYVSRTGRVLRWNLKPGQSIKEHSVPDSPFYVVVLQGTGIFTGGDGKEYSIRANNLVVFEPGEKHSIRALDENLVFVGFLEGVPSNTSDKIGGMIGHTKPTPR